MKATRQTWWLWERFETWLSGLSEWSSPIIFGGFLVWFVSWTVLAGAVSAAVIDEADRASVAEIAGQLTPAAGVLFALLTAFVITNQWNRTRQAETVVGIEADAAIRVAMASQSPGIDGSKVRRLLTDHLHVVLETEWATLRHEQAGCAEAAASLAQLTRDVRTDATDDGVSPAVTTDLLSATEGLAVARRDRLNLSGHGLPAPLFLLAFVSGIVLCLDVVAIAEDPAAWGALLIAGLVIMVALDLALIVAISDPFRGPMRVLPLPVRAVLGDIDAGLYGDVAAPSAHGTPHDVGGTI